MSSQVISTAQKFYDKHTLYIDSGAIPKQNLEKIILSAITETVNAQKKLGIVINPNHRLNIVRNKDNESLGYAYLWVEDIQLYNICNKLNADGSPREKVIPDPNWKPRTITPSEPFSPVTFANVMQMQMNWAELSDDEENEVQPMIVEKLDSLIKFNVHNYTSIEQKDLDRIYLYTLNKRAFNLYNENISYENKKSAQEIWNLYEGLINHNTRDGYSKIDIYSTIIEILSEPSNYAITLDNFGDLFNELIDQIEVEPLNMEKHLITISGAYVLNVEEGEQRNSLSAKYFGRIPNVAEIRKHFIAYNTSKNTKFPMVNIIEAANKKGGFVNVVYDDKQRDAQFALYFTRKVEFDEPKGSLLLFNMGKSQRK
jgi:hypothetical protein